MRRRRKLPPPGPPPPPSDYGVLLGSKLRLLFRAPSGVYGNEVLAQRWTDEVRKLVLPRDVGTPVLEPDGANFIRKSVVRLNPSPTTRFLSANAPAFVEDGEGPELFAVARAVTLDAANRILFVLSDATLSTFAAGLFFGVNTFSFGAAGGSTSGAFADTATPHLFTGRFENGSRVVSVDGVDINSGSSGLSVSACSRAYIGSSAAAFDGFLGMCGLINPPMTPDERAGFLRIARAEWGF